MDPKWRTENLNYHGFFHYILNKKFFKIPTGSVQNELV